jgi:hypothetical protein
VCDLSGIGDTTMLETAAQHAYLQQTLGMAEPTDACKVALHYWWCTEVRCIRVAALF